MTAAEPDARQRGLRQQVFAAAMLLLAAAGFGLCAAYGAGLLKPQLTFGSATIPHLNVLVAFLAAFLVWQTAGSRFEPRGRFWWHVGVFAVVIALWLVFATWGAAPQDRHWWRLPPLTLALSLLLGWSSWAQEKRKSAAGSLNH